MTDSLIEWNAMLARGVVFNWDFAARMIRTYGAYVAEACRPGRGSVVIWKDGAPAPRALFDFTGNDVIELRIGPEVWNCVTAKEEHPDWDASTYWPEGALAIVNAPRERA